MVPFRFQLQNEFLFNSFELTAFEESYEYLAPSFLIIADAPGFEMRKAGSIRHVFLQRGEM
jgi:hypothetical protein